MLSGRSSVYYCKWPDEEGYTEHAHATKVIARKATQSDRYMAINLENDGTIELRYWRGTTLPAAILGAAAIESALFYWSETLTVRDIGSGGITWTKFLAWTADNRKEEYEAIVTFCALRADHLTKNEAVLCA
jgi:hypothetical protein